MQTLTNILSIKLIGLRALGSMHTFLARIKTVAKISVKHDLRDRNN